MRARRREMFAIEFVLQFMATVEGRGRATKWSGSHGEDNLSRRSQ